MLAQFVITNFIKKTTLLLLNYNLEKNKTKFKKTVLVKSDEDLSFELEFTKTDDLLFISVYTKWAEHPDMDEEIVTLSLEYLSIGVDCSKEIYNMIDEDLELIYQTIENELK